MRRKFSFLILFTTILFVGAAPLFGQGTPPGGRGPTAAPLANIITNSTTTAVGVNALQNNTTGFGNTASGESALRYNTTGFGNTASGEGALRYNTTGIGNTASGIDALRFNTTGAFNTASGRGALLENTTGINNTASGESALRYNTTGFGNTASGESALLENTTGFNNTAVGDNALLENTTGFSNIAVGTNAGSNQTTGSNNIYVHSVGVEAESDTIRIGTVGTQTRTFIAGISGVTAAGTAVPVLIDTKGQLGTISSSRRFKEEIRDMGEASSRIMQLRPVTFRYKKENGDGARPLQFGLIAEEVTEVYPGLVQYSATGEANAVLYHLLNAMLLNEVQKQHRQIQEQKERIADLTVRLVRLETLEAERDTFAVLTK